MSLHRMTLSHLLSIASAFKYESFSFSFTRTSNTANFPQYPTCLGLSVRSVTPKTCQGIQGCSSTPEITDSYMGLLPTLYWLSYLTSYSIFTCDNYFYYLRYSGNSFFVISKFYFPRRISISWTPFSAAGMTV